MTPARLSLVFSCIGHACMHLFAVYFFLIVLPLEQEWGLPYHQLIELWTVGALLVGVMALPAGWLGDRWSAPGMLIVFFVGVGASAAVCGLASSPRMMWIGLCGLGTFAAIYHPVGVGWLVRTTTQSRGKALGVNGIFGSVGVAGAGVIAGTLIDLFGWRAAFLIPAAVSAAIGLVMFACLRAGLVTDVRPEPSAEPEGRPREQLRAFVILLVTMFGGAMIYQASQAVMPKLFATRLVDLIGASTFGVGAFVGIVYGLAGLTQVAAGHLADRYDLKRVYLGTFVAQVPMLWLAASVGGLPLIAASTVLVIANTGSLPAENMLLASATPARRHGLAFGIKFVLAFGAAPLAIKLVAYINDATGGFYWVFVTLALVGLAVCIAGLLIPSSLPRPVSRQGVASDAGTLAPPNLSPLT